jgi:hypothetical protein
MAASGLGCVGWCRQPARARGNASRPVGGGALRPAGGGDGAGRWRRGGQWAEAVHRAAGGGSTRATAAGNRVQV